MKFNKSRRYLEHLKNAYNICEHLKNKCIDLCEHNVFKYQENKEDPLFLFFYEESCCQCHLCLDFVENLSVTLSSLYNRCLP